jgi:hypothetical protein
VGTHAVDRLSERYGERGDLSDSDLHELRKMVERGDTVFVRRGHSERAVRKAVMNGMLYVFVWSYRSGDFVTFLPNEEGEEI